MTIAAAQLRLWIVENYPGTPISRFACRDTATGGISQHSAYGSPMPEWSDGRTDSNALDVFGPNKTDGPLDQAWIQTIVDEINGFDGNPWSIRKIIWRDGGAHENHAHIDMWPLIADHKWCGQSWTPTWRYSDGSTVQTRDPEPENGEFHGGNPMTCTYRTVINCPSDDGVNPKPYVASAIDWGIDVGLIVIDDDNVDDWTRNLEDGRYWVFSQRMDAYYRGLAEE